MIAPASPASEIDQYLVISWLPGIEMNYFKPTSDMNEVEKHLQKSSTGFVDTIIWLRHDSEPEYEAVLLIEDAEKVFKSAEIWSAFDIQNWFNVVAGKYDDNKHYLRVVPDYDKSGDRFIQNTSIITGVDIPKSKLKIVYGMLSFISEGGQTASLLPTLGASDRIRVSVVDSSIISKDTPQDAILDIVGSESYSFGSLPFSVVDLSQEAKNED